MITEDSGAFSEKEEPASSPDAEPVPVSDDEVETSEETESDQAAQRTDAADGPEESLPRTSPEVSDEIARSYLEVPEIGTRWRWYDWPYRALDLAFTDRKYWPKTPKSIRRPIHRAQHWLRMFNYYDREKIRHLEDPMYNIVVPDGEKVSLPCFWLVEYYSPSHAEELMRRISTKKWANADFSHPEALDVAVQEGRQHDGQLGWRTIATLVRPDYKGYFPNAVRRKLPHPFSSISLSLLPLGSALTAVVAQFHLTESAAASLDDALRAAYHPRLYKYKGSLQVRQRVFVGLEAVQTKREELHQAAREWFARELPGLFAVEAKASHPTLDMLFTQKFNPFRKGHSDLSERNFERALGFDQEPFSLMYSPNWKRVRVMEYGFKTTDREQRDRGLALVAKYTDALGRKNDFKHVGDERSEHAITWEINFGAPGLLTRYGLFELLRVKQEAASRARDRASSLHSRRPVTSAKKLRNSVLRSSIDMAMVARDIETLTASTHLYEWEVPELERRQREKEGWTKNEKGLLKEWAKRQGKEARRLADLDRELLGILDLASNLNASIEGIRSQRWSLVIAVLSLASSGAAVWFAYLALASTAATGGG